MQMTAISSLDLLLEGPPCNVNNASGQTNTQSAFIEFLHRGWLSAGVCEMRVVSMLTFLSHLRLAFIQLRKNPSLERHQRSSSSSSCAL
jgi:hypothetical protein